MTAAARHASAPSGSSGLDPALARALADELVGLTTQLSDLAYDLGSNSDTLRRHMESLQAIDHVTQVQLAIAELLRDDEPLAQRLASIPLQDLADRLTGRMEAVTSGSDHSGDNCC